MPDEALLLLFLIAATSPRAVELWHRWRRRPTSFRLIVKLNRQHEGRDLRGRW